MSQKVHIGTADDAPLDGHFVYEPSSHHTYETFLSRQRRRQEEALRNSQAIEGSVNEPKMLPAPAAVPASPPAVILLRDESGFGECCVPADLSYQPPIEDYCGC